MTEIRIEPDQVAAWGQGVIPALAALLTKSAAMGVLTGPPITNLDSGTVRRLVKALHRHGIGADAGVALEPLVGGTRASIGASEQRRLVASLARLNEALDASAAPAAEWPAMRTIFGDEALVELLGLGASSLRRYASGGRATPDPVAARLHWLALVVADLAGSYNEFGIRRWFERPRAQLGGRSPRQVLGSDWSPDGEAARGVRELASVLTGANPLAA